MSKKTWNYRVIEFVGLEGTPWRAIHEVHYENANPVSYSEEPAAIIWTSNDGNKAPTIMLKNMKEALDKPVLVETDFKNSATNSR